MRRKSGKRKKRRRRRGRKKKTKKEGKEKKSRRKRDCKPPRASGRAGSRRYHGQSPPGPARSAGAAAALPVPGHHRPLRAGAAGRERLPHGFMALSGLGWAALCWSRASFGTPASQRQPAQFSCNKKFIKEFMAGCVKLKFQINQGSSS